MTKNNTLRSRVSDKNSLKDKLVSDNLNHALKKALGQNEKGCIILLEIPSDYYMQTNLDSIKMMINNGFEGVYISFQRPFNNLLSLFKQRSIDVNKIFVVDCATALTGEKINFGSRCIGVSQDFELEDIIKVVVLNLGKLRSDKKFIFVDSLSTFSLHNSFFNVSRFPELLVDTIRKNNFKHFSCVFNVSEGLPQKIFVENLSSYGEECINLGLCK